MSDQITSNLETVLNNLDEKLYINNQISISEYKTQYKLLRDSFCTSGYFNDEGGKKLLSLLIENNIHSIHKDLIAILDGNIDKRLERDVLCGIKKYLIKLITSNNFTGISALYELWKQHDLEKFKTILSSLKNEDECVSNNCTEFLIEDFLPHLIYCQHNELRQSLVQFALLFIELFPISCLKPEGYKSFLSKLPSFFSTVVELQEKGEEVWRDIFHFLLKYLDHKFTNSEVQEIFHNSPLNWNILRKELDDNLTSECLKHISECNIDELTRVYADWKNLDPQKFSDALKILCNDPITNAQTKIFLFEKLIPIMMDTTNVNDALKIHHIDLGLEFALAFQITQLNNEEFGNFLKKVNDYIKNISDLRDSQFSHWEKLWMFLVRLFGKKLHHSMSLINKLLRVVEHAFRNSTFEQRLKGYDCWKELIDNGSLDAVYLSSDKQIRLLLTPLRAKFSKQEAVIIKRFDVFIYLIQKLQDKGILVLKEFLEFCFGDVSEDTDPHKSGQGRSFSGLWLRSAKAFLAILGHSHENYEHCLETEDELRLKAPIVTSTNIHTHCSTIVNSVVECCILLKDVELDQHRQTVLKCFWKSLLNIISQTKGENQKKIVDALYKSLEKLLKGNDPYCNSIAAIIFKCTIDLNQDDAFPIILSNLSHFLNIIFSVPLGTDGLFKVEKLIALLDATESKENKDIISSCVYQSFSKFKTSECNVDYVALVWIKWASMLEDNDKLKLQDFAIWPALHRHQITDSEKEALLLSSCSIVYNYVEKNRELYINILKGFEKVLKNNPLLLDNILSLFPILPVNTTDEGITNVSLDLLTFIINTPFSETDDKCVVVESFLKSCYNKNLNKLQDYDAIKKLCGCVEYVLKSKRYAILGDLKKALKNMPDNVKSIHAKHVSVDFLVNLLESEKNVKNTTKIHSVIEILRNVSDVSKDKMSFIPPGGRSAKIAGLVKEMSLKHFGKDVETKSPVNVKGSYLKDSPSPSVMKPPATVPEKKPKTTISIDDESNSKFVLIDSEVKIKPNEMTEHQKETLKKRREDIPALYQDLSQSLTQTFDSTSDCSKSNNVVIKKETKEDDSTETILKEGTTNDFTNKFPITEKPEDVKKENTPLCLKNLVMNIVGADEFSSLPAKRKRKEKESNNQEQDKTTTEESLEEKPAVAESTKEIPLSKPEEPDLAKTPLVQTPNKVAETPKRRGRPPRRQSSGETSSVEREEGKHIEDGLEEGLKETFTQPETTEAKVPAKRKRGRPAQAKLESPKIESDVSSCNEDVVKEEVKDELKIVLNMNPIEIKRSPRRPAGTPKSKTNTPSSAPLRKSTRKSIPTPKLTEFYKETSEQNRLDSETSDSTLAKDNTNLETSKETPKSDKVDQKKKRPRKPRSSQFENEVTGNLTNNKKGKKRKRESSESDDLIESSQDSSTNITVRKKSFTKNKSDNLQITLDSFISPAKNTDTSKLVLKEDGIPQEGVVNAIPEDHEAAKETVVPDPSASEDLFIHLEKSQNTEPKKRPRRKRKSSKAARTPVSKESTTETSHEEHFKTSPKSEKEEETVPVLDTECFVELDSISIPIQSLQNDTIKRTQSQETETQGTESVGVLSENIELQLDVPKNPDLTEKDKEMAEMETASMPLDSSNDETKVANVTAIERVVEENVSVSRLDNTTVVNNQTEETLHNSSVVHNDMDTIPETEIVCHSESEIVCNSEPETVCNPESEAVCKFEPKAVCNSVPESVCDSEPEVICNSEPEGVCNSEAAVTSEHDETNLGSPDRSIASSGTNIPSSPVTGDTPNRNSELLNNTLDISPISQKNSPENGSCDDGEIEETQPKIVPVALKFDHEDHENDGKEKSPEKGDDAPEKIVQTHMENQDAVKADQPTTSRDNIAERSNKFLTALNGSSRLIAKRKMLKTMSPSASRIKKLMSNVMANSFEEVTTNVSQDDILTFTREVPSPLAVPRSSILKRKHSDTADDGLSPCPKRKRVNFSDPCTTEKKIFIKDDNSHCLFTSTEDDEEDIDRQFLAVLTAGSVESLEIETESIHTEESLQINNPLILCDDRPIFADLINCDADINVIARKLTGPMFLKALLNKLRNKGINTIGDLARKSEIEISKMPFKSPGVSNVYKVLERYHAKHCKENAKVEQLNVSVVPVENEVTTVVDTAQNDLVKAVERVKCEGTSTETICTTLFPLLDQNEILTYTKSYYQLEEKSDQSESKIDQESQTAANDLEQDDPGTSETELINPEDYNPVEKLIGQLSSSEFSEEELVKIFGVVTDKMASLSPKRLLQISIETLQKITFKD